MPIQFAGNPVVEQSLLKLAKASIDEQKPKQYYGQTQGEHQSYYFGVEDAYAEMAVRGISQDEFRQTLNDAAALAESTVKFAPPAKTSPLVKLFQQASKELQPRDLYMALGRIWVCLGDAAADQYHNDSEAQAAVENLISAIGQKVGIDFFAKVVSASSP